MRAVWASTPFQAIVFDDGGIKRRQSPRAYDAIDAEAYAGLKLLDRRLGLRSEDTVGSAAREGFDEFAAEVRKQVL
jgi:hypothetical protein